MTDLAPHYAAARLAVAPLRFGAGLKGKVVESWAHGLPCVMTPIAAEGLPLSAELGGAVAGDAEGCARLIVRLHDDAGYNAGQAWAGHAWAGQARAGRGVLRGHFSRARTDAALADAIATPRRAATSLGLRAVS